MLFFNDRAGDVLLPYVRVSDLDVSGYREYGIAIGWWNGRSGFSDVRVERVVSHDNGDSGMVTYAAARNVHRNVYVGASRFYDNQGQPDSPTNSGSGLVLGGVDGATVERQPRLQERRAEHDDPRRRRHLGLRLDPRHDPTQRVVRQPHRRTRRRGRVRLRPERVELDHAVQLLPRQRRPRFHAGAQRGLGCAHRQRHPLQRQPERRAEERHGRDPHLRADHRRGHLPEHRLPRPRLRPARRPFASTASSPPVGSTSATTSSGPRVVPRCSRSAPGRSPTKSTCSSRGTTGTHPARRPGSSGDRSRTRRCRRGEPPRARNGWAPKRWGPARIPCSSVEMLRPSVIHPASTSSATTTACPPRRPSSTRAST